jgi:hypothetical protein
LNILFPIVQITLLFAIIFQDFKHRAVFWIFFPLLFISNILISYYLTHGYLFILNIAVNSAIFIAHLLSLTLYFSFRHKGIVNIVNTYIGLGDILMFLAITVIFSPVFYLVFIIIALIFSLFYAWAFMPSGKKISSVPLAGIMAIVYLPVTFAFLFQPARLFIYKISQLSF